jgi:hypothetical protein
MNSFNCIYPNPFKYGKVKKTLNYEKMLKDIYQSIKPFLKDDFSLIHQQVDEFGNPKLEKRFKRIFQTNIEETSSLVKEKIFFFSKPIKAKLLSFNNLNNYYDNLRYLELPVQSSIDKHGFEIQLLSSELVEEAIEEIDEGLSYIYSYLPNNLPESIESWNDYALLNPNQFPYVFHDKLLEYNYELIDRVFDEIQKNSTTLFNSFITGDLNTRVLNIITPSFKKAKIDYVLICIQSVFGLTILMLIIQYIVLNYSDKIGLLNKKALLENLSHNAINIRKQFVIKHFKFQQKTKKLKSKLLSLKVQIKYGVSKFVLSTDNL